MKIVAAIGTKGPFDRLVKALSAYKSEHPDCEIWVQHGDSALPPDLSGAATVPREELLQRMRDADRLVVHAGCGTLLDALSMGHQPIVVPRLARFGEHVNDHQLELAEALATRSIILKDVSGLGAALERAQPRSSEPADIGHSRATLVAALRNDLAEAQRLRARPPLVLLRWIQKMLGR